MAARQIKITQTITDRDSRALNLHFRDISRRSVPTIDEEVDLARRIHLGDKKALDQLVERNMRFVVSIANQYTGQGLPLGDLISEGHIGLIEAARRFDETRGFKFTTYAVWWIRQSITKALGDSALTIRIPGNRRSACNKVKTARSRFVAEFGYEPTDDQLVQLTHLDLDTITSVSNLPGAMASLDTPVGDDSDTTIGSMMSDADYLADRNIEKESLCDEIADVLRGFTERERRIITMSFGLDGAGEHSIQEIANALNLSHERVRQIREGMLRRLSHNPDICRRLRKYVA